MSSKRVLVAVAAVVVSALVVGGCSSDGGSEGAEHRDASRSTSTAGPGDRSTSPGSGGSTTSSGGSAGEPASSTTGAAEPIPTTTVVKPSGGPTSWRGVVDGQPDVAVTFRFESASIADLRADDLEVVCQPLASGDTKHRTVDVRIPVVAIGPDDSVAYTQKGAELEPSLNGTFTTDGRFAGSLFLSGQDDGYACGGEFTFIAVHG